MTEGVERALQRFLGEHTNGPVYVYTAHTAGWGFKKLGELTRRRPVTLLLADASTAIGGGMADATWEAARTFLERTDVAVIRLGEPPLGGPAEEMLFICDPHGSHPATFHAHANLEWVGVVDPPLRDPSVQDDSPADSNLTSVWLPRFRDAVDQKVAVLRRLGELAGRSVSSGGASVSDAPRPEDDPFAVSDERGSLSDSGKECGPDEPPPLPPPPEPPRPPEPPPPPPSNGDSRGWSKWLWVTTALLLAAIAVFVIFWLLGGSPDESSTTGPTLPPTTTGTEAPRDADCHPGYESQDDGWCVPDLPEGEDLECSDVPAAAKPIRVLPWAHDRYWFDGDGNGWGCGRAPSVASPPNIDCHPGYQSQDSNTCLPDLPDGEDIECDHIHNRLKPIRALSGEDDRYRLDGDGDGWGCGPAPPGSTSETTDAGA